MAVNGIELAAGQKWRTRKGEIVVIAHPVPGEALCWEMSHGHRLTDEGRFWSCGDVSDGDLVELLSPAPTLQEVSDRAMQAIEDFTAMPAGAVASGMSETWREVLVKGQGAARLSATAQGLSLKVVGDITSTAKGSGARYNAGKPPLELVPLRIVSQYYQHTMHLDTPRANAITALSYLGAFQERGDMGSLLNALAVLGDGWTECAQVFDYGRGKYVEFNWAKGMAWSVPIACAARHLLAMIRGEVNDPESGLPHRGHVFCNIVMLMTYEHTFPEGDDRAPAGYLAPLSVAA